jgi:hypothetical protein
MLALPSFKRRESQHDIISRRLGIATKQDMRDAVKAAERIVRGR